MEIVKVKILDPKVKRLLSELESLNLIQIESNKTDFARKRRFGSMKGLVVQISDDFDAPVEDFQDYM